MKYTVNGDRVTVYLRGRIDANNSSVIGAELDRIIAANKNRKMLFDASGLDYISSAGLRLLLRVNKEDSGTMIVNVSNEVYDILEITGFTEIFVVKKKLKELVTDKSQLIGAGANGRVYRLGDERIVKVYNTFSNPPEKIERERLSARKAFVKGIPSAIPYDIVKVGSELGMIYELIDAKTLGTAVHAEPARTEEYALMMSALLKRLHSTAFDEGELPDARGMLKKWVTLGARSGYYRLEDIEKVNGFIDRIPAGNTFVHGDFHPGNIMLSNGELILIDMGDASMGHPVTDLLGTYQMMRLLTKKNDAAAIRYTGMTTEEVSLMWDIFVRDYFGTEDEAELENIGSSLRCYALIRSLAGVAFSDIVPEEQRGSLADKVMGHLLRGMETAVPVP